MSLRSCGPRVSIPVAMEIVSRRRSPDRRLARRPYFRPLRLVVMPGTRLEISKLFVEHLIELTEELDHMVVVVAVVGGDIMPGAVAQRSPDDRDLLLPQHLARVLQVREVFELEGDVMQLGAASADEIDGVMVGVAAHEDKEVADPVGHPEAHDAPVKLRRLLRARHREGHMPELQRSGAEHLLVAAEIAPLREQLDGRSFVVLEGEHLADARDRVIAQLALDAVLGKLAGELVELRVRRHLERQFGAARRRRLVELDDELADLAGEERPVFLALGELQSVDLGEIDDGLFEVRRLERRVSDSSWLDHSPSSVVSSVTADAAALKPALRAPEQPSFRRLSPHIGNL